MASLSANRKGQFSIQFRRPGGRRETLYLGPLPKRYAQEFVRRVELLLQSSELREPLDPATSQWLAELAPSMRDKLAGRGLCETTKIATVGELCDYCIGQADVEPATIIKYQDAAANLQSYFTPGRRIHEVTSGDAVEFRQWLRSSGRRPTPGPLAESTAAIRLKQAKQFFAVAVRKRWLLENPFAGIRVGATVNRERMFFVDRELVDRIMAEAPDVEFRLLIALARWGGLRIPSEALPLRWESVDWDPELGQLRVLSVKTKRHAHKRWRSVPLFPELRAALQDAFDAAPVGAEYLIERYRHVTATALRNRLERLCRRVGVPLWSKPWQNMRSTRETELLESYPIHVVCQWIGNSPAVALRHYGQVTKEHHARATSAAIPEERVSL